jgi:hypothetical protein
MAQVRDRARLAHEALARPRREERAGGQHLERDAPAAQRLLARQYTVPMPPRLISVSSTNPRTCGSTSVATSAALRAVRSKASTSTRRCSRPSSSSPR